MKPKQSAQLKAQLSNSGVAKHIRDAVDSSVEQEHSVLAKRAASIEDLRFHQGRLSVLREIQKLLS